MNLVKNPLFKFFGIIAIIYLAVFYGNEKNRNIVQKTLSKDNMQKQTQNVFNKVVHIKSSLDKKKKYEERKLINSQIKNSNQGGIEKNLQSGRSANCGDLIIVDFTKKNDVDTIKEKNYRMKIDKSDLSLGIIGMKINEDRTIIITEQLEDDTVKFIYNVKLVGIVESSSNDVCF